MFNLRWLITFPVMFVLFFVGRALSPFACLFITHVLFTDKVKRFGKLEVTMPRERLVWWLRWFDTHDNASDEYWYGMYDDWILNLLKVNQEMYDNSKVIRYYCRVMWLQRNNLYTFNEKFFSKPLEDDLGVIEFGDEDTPSWTRLTMRKDSFQYEAHRSLWFGYWSSINIGWKKHKGQPRMIYAGRIFGLKKGV